ncbi:zinc-binding dehydrogenase [Bradyrhizobium sp. I1.8.5]|uniref:zinc-binding dehydrogenase n=1 Tax=Bradyrhizobium sp. I1.8.5 TaxID=3156365 RepID=UPI0033910ABF
MIRVGGDVERRPRVDVTTERLRVIAELIDRGELRTYVGAVLPLSDTRDAHMMFEGRRVVLNVDTAHEIKATGR